MKKAICSALILLMFLNAQASCLAVSLPSINKEKQTNLTLEEEKDDIVIPKKLKKEIKDEIIKIYGLDSADEIFNKVYEIAKKAKEERPEILLKADLNRDSDWYKDEIIYTFYADQFGTNDTKKPNKFDDTAQLLDYLSDLGVTTLHILPFADSPMNDAGLVVKIPKNARSASCGMPQFNNFITAYRNR